MGSADGVFIIFAAEPRTNDRLGSPHERRIGGFHSPARGAEAFHFIAGIRVLLPLGGSSMSRKGLRPLSAVVLIFLFTILSTTAVSAHTTRKSINTTTGPCTGGACGSLVYGGSGVSGRLFGSGPASLFDYVCVHKPADAAPQSFGGTYTLTVTSGGVVLASTSYTVASGLDCSGQGNAATGNPATFTYPSSGFVDYSVAISGVTSGNAQRSFSRYDSILDRDVDSRNDECENSPRVPPPGPGGEVPEVPAAALLILTGGLGTGWYLLRRRSGDSSITTS